MWQNSLMRYTYSHKHTPVCNMTLTRLDLLAPWRRRSHPSWRRSVITPAPALPQPLLTSFQYRQRRNRSIRRCRSLWRSPCPPPWHARWRFWQRQRMSLLLLHNCVTFTYTTFRTSPNSLPSPPRRKLYRPLSKGQSTSPLLPYHITLPIHWQTPLLLQSDVLPPPLPPWSLLRLQILLRRINPFPPRWKLLISTDHLTYLALCLWLMLWLI